MSDWHGTRSRRNVPGSTPHPPPPETSTSVIDESFTTRVATCFLLPEGAPGLLRIDRQGAAPSPPTSMSRADPVRTPRSLVRRNTVESVRTRPSLRPPDT